MSGNQNEIEIIARMKDVRVLCIGDAMLDQSVYGTVDRVSPDAPVPVLFVTQDKYMPGGAANVATNVRALGAGATLVAAVGADADAAILAGRLEALGIEAALVTATDRPTILKTRFLCGTQHLLRADREKAAPLSAADEDKVIALALAALPGAGAVILSDYKKGLLTDRVVAEVIAAARQKGIPVIADPKGRDFTRYRGCAAITPNAKELEGAAELPAGTDDDVRAACMKIISTCGVGAVLATRGAAGLSLVAENAAPLHLPATTRQVLDVAGAGDTAVAAFAAALATGAGMADAALIANTAAGITVGKTGTSTAKPQEVAAALAPTTGKFRRTKLVTKMEAAAEAEQWRAQGLTVGFTNGTFDLLHPGHVSSIRQARENCDRLVVAINSDASVKRYKGPTRPVQDETARAAILSALETIDLVVVFEEDTPIELLKAIKPDILVKGGQYKLEEVVGYDIVMAYGGRIVRADMEDGFSTTNTIKKMAS